MPSVLERWYKGPPERKPNNQWVHTGKSQENLKVMKDKERLRNWHRLEETKKKPLTWFLEHKHDNMILGYKICHQWGKWRKSNQIKTIIVKIIVSMWIFCSYHCALVIQMKIPEVNKGRDVRKLRRILGTAFLYF